MSKITIEKKDSLRGVIKVPGDKSISHRAIMLSSLAKGESRITNFLNGLDCIATVDAFRRLGVSITFENDSTIIVQGKGLHGLSRPVDKLYLGNSGTTMRLLLGILSGQFFKTTLTGDRSLSKRPMKRVTEPLSLMGADIKGKDNSNFSPLVIEGANLKAIDYNSPIASAQVKSSILLAALYAKGITTVTEPFKSRDHSERMFELFDIPIKENQTSVSVEGLGSKELEPKEIEIPGDISSAAFFIALGALAKDSDIKILSCGINPTRTGIIKVLQRMGADIDINDAAYTKLFEPKADITIRTSPLSATRITKEEIPSLIDEIPIIALCATQAKGETTIEGISELRVKETDRVESIMSALNSMGANISVDSDTLIIRGPSRLKGQAIKSFGDHRTAMMGLIAGSIADGKTSIDDTKCIETSFPGFFELVKSLL